MMSVAPRRSSSRIAPSRARAIVVSNRENSGYWVRGHWGGQCKGNASIIGVSFR
jgi:hypothetical protein